MGGLYDTVTLLVLGSTHSYDHGCPICREDALSGLDGTQPIEWPGGAVAQWLRGPMAQWPNGSMAVAQWPNGPLGRVQWPRGPVGGGLRVLRSGSESGTLALPQGAPFESEWGTLGLRLRQPQGATFGL